MDLSDEFYLRTRCEGDTMQVEVDLDNTQVSEPGGKEEAR